VILQKTRAIFVFLACCPGAVFAQTTDPRPLSAVEFTAGYAGFVDEETIDHTVLGGALRVHLTPLISVGPELQYMIGPGDERDLILTGNVTIDVLRRRVTPFVVFGGGLFHHSGEFGSSTEGSFTAGPGVRGWLNDRVYVASELRLGWELHYRITGTVGVALGR
jgi:hypothetical protein